MSTDAHDVFTAAFGAFSQVSAPAAVAALWQGVAVAATLALCLRLAPRVSAAHRFAAWAAGFAAVVCLPFLPVLVHAAAGSQFATAAPASGSRRETLASIRQPLGLCDCRAMARRIPSPRHRSRPSLAPPAQAMEECHADSRRRRRCGVKASPHAPVEICTTRHLDRPSVIGFFAPRILIPDWLFARLTPAELEQVVLHEAEHLRRHDDWINLLQKLALVLFPLNPALAWMERRLCREREMACDEGVVHRTQAPRAYAACLTSLAERGLQRSLDRRAEALSLGAWQRRPELVRRVHSILCGKQALHPLAARALVGVVGCGLLLASVELARCPQTVAFVAAPQPHPAGLAQIQAGSTTSCLRASSRTRLPRDSSKSDSARECPRLCAHRRCACVPCSSPASAAASSGVASRDRPLASLDSN